MVQVTERVSRGLFSRLFSSLVGVIIGLIMIPASVLLIGWNEYRTVHRAKGLLEGERVVVEVANPETVDTTLTGKLIHTTGLASTSEELSDPEFGVSGNLLRLRREVQMYQWVEKVESKTRKKVGGGEETVKTYSYDKQWRSGREKSESFHESSKYVNPQPRFDSSEQVSNRATLGAFTLRPEQVSEIDSWTEVRLDQAALTDGFDQATRDLFKVQGAYLYFGLNKLDTTAPQVGDLRIRFEIVEPTKVSVLGKQEQTTITAFETSNGESIDALTVGQVSSSEMFAALKRQNSFLAMLLRFVGWIVSIFGFSLIAAPLKTLSDVVPLLGNLVGTATFFIALILGTCVSLIAISIAWIAVRPVYSIGLLAVVGIGLYWVFRRREKPSSQAPEQPPMATFAE